MRECVELFLLYIAIAGGTVVLFGHDLTWQEKLGIHSILGINRCGCVSYNRSRCIIWINL